MTGPMPTRERAWLLRREIALDDAQSGRLDLLVNAERILEVEAFDAMVVGPDVRDLIDAGYLAPFRYLASSTAIDLSQVRAIAGDFNTGDLEKAIDQDGITGDVVGHCLKHLAGQTAIEFCVTVAHTKHVTVRFRDKGILAASIDGTMSANQRHDLVTSCALASSAC